MFGQTRAVKDSANFTLNISDLIFDNVITEEGYANKTPELEGIMGENISNFEYNKMLPILKQGHKMLMNLKIEGIDQNPCDWAKMKKRNKTSKSMPNLFRTTSLNTYKFNILGEKTKNPCQRN